MRKYAIISTNSNPDYSFFLPICSAFWHRAGFNTISLVVDNGQHSESLKVAMNYDKYADERDITHIIDAKQFPCRDATVSQVSRLLGWMLGESNDYFILGDIDMLQLDANYWGDTSGVNIYGHDITGFGQIPMCYVGAFGHQWAEIIDHDNESTLQHNLLRILFNDTDIMDKVKSQDFYKWWDIDQHILTESIKNYGIDKCRKIDRGTDRRTGMVYGRIDRANWRKRPERDVDAHCIRPAYSEQNWSQFRPLLERYGFDFDIYRDLFIKTLNT